MCARACVSKRSRRNKSTLKKVSQCPEEVKLWSVEISDYKRRLFGHDGWFEHRKEAVHLQDVQVVGNIFEPKDAQQTQKVRWEVGMKTRASPTLAHV